MPHIGWLISTFITLLFRSADILKVEVTWGRFEEFNWEFECVEI